MRFKPTPSPPAWRAAQERQYRNNRTISRRDLDGVGPTRFQSAGLKVSERTPARSLALLEGERGNGLHEVRGVDRLGQVGLEAGVQDLRRHLRRVGGHGDGARGASELERQLADL